MLKDELRQFYGTENYYRIQPTAALMTDGVKYFADKAEAYWLMTDIAINGVMHEKLRNEPFIVANTRRKTNGGIIVQYEDGNYNPLLLEEYPLSDLPDDANFTLWMVDNVILLPSEY